MITYIEPSLQDRNFVYKDLQFFFCFHSTLDLSIILDIRRLFFWFSWKINRNILYYFFLACCDRLLLFFIILRSRNSNVVVVIIVCWSLNLALPIIPWLVERPHKFFLVMSLLTYKSNRWNWITHTVIHTYVAKYEW